MSTTGKLANLRDADTHAVTATVEQGGMVLVDFWAEWCGPCRSLEPVIADIATRRPDLTVLKVDIEQNGALADDFAIKSVPTFLLFKDGVCIDRRTGKVPFVELDRMITKNA
jgi:thioredoxin